MKRTELLLIHAVLTDVGTVTHTSIDRDWQTIQSRVGHEGPSFITITLPTFAKDFERSLELGRIDPNLFRSFRKSKDKRLIPAFLQGIVSLVFDDSGVLRTNPSIEAIDGVRQVCLLYNKLKLECSDERKAKAIQSFKSCESDLRSFRPKNWSYIGYFSQCCRLLYGGVFSELERELHRGNLVPRHGPGSVVERLTSNGKYRWKVWSRRLERYFPADTYLYANTDHLLSEGSGFSWSGLDDSVRVIFVPKTQKSPRVIAIEPVYQQYVQQSLMAPLVTLLESDPLTRGSLLFTNSKVNGTRARLSSVHRKDATLDLSEASDRVHAGLAYELVRDYPSLASAIFSCRTKYASLPDKTKVSLAKFASMGSALCFPVEAMVFYAMAVMAVLKSRNLTLSYKNIARIKRDISVFGDDIIVPVDAVSFLREVLVSAKLKVNDSKTFVKGHFRESCGVDAYAGHNVTPVYVRQLAPSRLGDAENLVSWASTANLLYKKGYWFAARYMREILDTICVLPHVGDDSSLIGYTSFLGSYSVGRWNKELHRFECRGLIAAVKKQSDKLEGYDRMLKFFLTRREEPVESEGFDNSAIRSSLHLKKRWATPF